MVHIFRGKLYPPNYVVYTEIKVTIMRKRLVKSNDMSYHSVVFFSCIESLINTYVMFVKSNK